MAQHNTQESTVTEILGVLSGFTAGHFSKRIAATDEPALASIVEKLNEVAQVLEAQTERGAIEHKSVDKTSDLNNQIELITDNIPSLIARIDGQGRYVFANKVYEEWFGISREQIIGKTHREVLPSAIFERAEPHIKCAMAGERVSFESATVGSEGRKMYVHTTFIPFKGADGSSDGFFSVVHDITPVKDAEIKIIHSSRLASMGQMAAGVAHEINNPLGIITGAANQLVKFSDNPEKFEAKIEAIKMASVRIARIVNGLKKFSRISDGPIHRNYSLSGIVREALVLTLSKAERHNTAVTCDLKTEALICCDEIEVEQVVINLITNSIDAITNRAEKWVKIDVLAEAQTVILRITDSGSGIPESIRSRIFEPFFTSKPVGEGTGLGLSISKGILDEHKATIAVVPDVPNTCFEIRFPKGDLTRAP